MKERKIYLDAMRGFAMILVVAWHLQVFSVTYENAFGNFFLRLHQPLFFLISGYLFYKPLATVSVRERLANLGWKVPAFVITPFLLTIIYSFVYGESYTARFETGKLNDYWFTVTLVEFMLVYLGGVWLNQRLTKARHSGLWIAGMMVLFVPSYQLLSTYIGARSPYVYQLIDVGHFKYFFYFMLGALMAQQAPRVRRLISDGRVMCGAVIALLVVMLWVYDGRPWLAVVYHYAATTVILFVTFALFRAWGQKNPENRCLKALAYCGRRSLEIYYFNSVFVYMDLWWLGDFFKAHPAPIIEFAILLLVSGLLTEAALIIGDIVRLSPQLAYFMLGIRKKRGQALPTTDQLP